MLEIQAPRSALRRRLQQSVPFGTLIGAAYSVVALILDAAPHRVARKLSWGPTLLDTLSPVLGGALMGFLLALLWPARRRRLTALSAGLIAALPFAASVGVSMAGLTRLHGAGLIAPAATTLVLGLVIGAFMHDYDRPLSSDSDEPAAELATATDERDD